MRWLRELLLGARLSLAGGRSGWLRTGLTALGVGLGVALLLVAVSVPNAMASRSERMAARVDVTYAEVPPKSETTILVGFADTTFRDQPIRGRLLQPDGAHPPVPPGLIDVPGPGELAVSPALARLTRLSCVHRPRTISVSRPSRARRLRSDTAARAGHSGQCRRPPRS